MQTRYDLAIVGSGGGAFAAAIRATTLGKSVVMIERGAPGFSKERSRTYWPTRFMMGAVPGSGAAAP